MVFSLSGSRVLGCRMSPFRWIFWRRAGNIVSSTFGKVSDDTLGTFSALLCGFSVLHWHGLSPSGSCVLGCRVSLSVWFLQLCWQRRKGFRRCVKIFFAASLWLLRPSLAFFVASPSSTGTVFPCLGAVFSAAVSAFRRISCSRAGNVNQVEFFYDPLSFLKSEKPHFFSGVGGRGGSPLSGQGPPGRVLAEGVSLLSVGERGCAPCRRPTPSGQKTPRFTVFCALPFFSISRILWLEMGQPGPT